ncbi:ArsC/Spx/MgsR family protein [Aestuariicoccus sp. MJ-SS9]|uniref:ArsC/Spx/MgsR family protein n=1 Tax=Aestuariicoccus sp. MJ-SS9 TaxID=3079855 RepID=UPI0029113286|nr:ArsC/Spx/MgsR family protein [Aestuariicoccus sp. MJ-SS9]MDU8910288.1 ArsC/Spx/MgsR family protein [Aestuariicoccus sp. MJ-SS9]
MILYGLKSCDTCKKARRALPQAQFVDVRDDGVPPEIMSAASARFGPMLLNTRSTTWRGLSDDEKTRAPMELLAAYPTLMKRPLIRDSDRIYLGWDAKTQAALGVSDA